MSVLMVYMGLIIETDKKKVFRGYPEIPSRVSAEKTISTFSRRYGMHPFNPPPFRF